MHQFVRFGLLAALSVGSLLIFKSYDSTGAELPVDSIERANLIDASDPSKNYAVIAPVYVSSTGANSFIRLFSGKGGAGETSTFTFSVVGGPSGRQYGSDYSIAIPYMASVQFSIQDILAVTRATALNGGDTSYALYLKNTDAQAGYQHVTFNPTTSLFENGNNCHTSINEQMIASHNAMVITNLHMPTIAAYPSTVTIHNHSALPANYLLDVYAGGVATVTGATATVANTAGRLLCQLSRSVAPNASATIPFSTISGSPDCQAPDSQFYANIQLRKANGLPPDATVAHWVRVNAYGGDSNLGGVCAVNRIARPAVTATKTIDAIVTNPSGDQGLLTVTIQAAAAASARAASVQNAQSGIEWAQASATATGTYTPATGSAVSLTGTYDTATNAVRLAGSGYTFTGAVTTSSYAGTYVGPNNAVGNFSAMAGNRPLLALCGTYSGAANNGRAALFFYSDGTLSGSVTTADNERLTLNGYHGAAAGAVSGNTLHGWANNGATFQGRFTSNSSAAGTAVSSDGQPLTFSFGDCPPPLSTFGVRG